MEKVFLRHSSPTPARQYVYWRKKIKYFRFHCGFPFFFQISRSRSTRPHRGKPSGTQCDWNTAIRSQKSWMKTQNHLLFNSKTFSLLRTEIRLKIFLFSLFRDENSLAREKIAGIGKLFREARRKERNWIEFKKSCLSFPRPTNMKSPPMPLRPSTCFQFKLTL